jgi:hypothetical protein
MSTVKTRDHNPILEWTPEMVDTLLRLTAQGRNAREVASDFDRYLSITLTRNAIIGKLTRLKALDPSCVIRPLVPREVKQLDHQRLSLPKPKRVRKPKSELPVANGKTKHVQVYNGPPELPTPVNDNMFAPLGRAEPKGMMDLTRHDCRWPVGDDLYCCEPVLQVSGKTSTYCRTHRQVSRRA